MTNPEELFPFLFHTPTPFCQRCWHTLSVKMHMQIRHFHWTDKKKSGRHVWIHFNIYACNSQLASKISFPEGSFIPSSGKWGTRGSVLVRRTGPGSEPDILQIHSSSRTVFPAVAEGMKRISSVCALIKLKQNGLQGKAAENIDAKWLCLTRKKYKEKKYRRILK